MQCAQCHIDFQSRSEQIYCSETCRLKAKKARRRLKNTRLFRCEHCSREFWRNPDRAHKYRFCSQTCSSEFQRKPVESKPVKVKPEPPVKICDTCWSVFTSKYPSQRFCSRGCVPAPRVKQEGPATLYYLRCGDRLKVGYSEAFTNRLQAIRAAVPFQVDVLMTRPGTLEEEQEFHRANKDRLVEFGGREWYYDTPEFRAEAETFMRLPVDTTL